MIPFVPPLGFADGDALVGVGPPTVRHAGIVNVANVNTESIAIPGDVVAGDLLLMFDGHGYAISNIPRADGISDRSNQPFYNGASAQRVITAADITAGSIVLNFGGAFWGAIGYVFLVGCPRVRSVTFDYQTSGTTGIVAADASAAAGDVAIIFSSALHNPSMAINGAPTLLATNTNTDSNTRLWSETLAGGAYSRTVTFGASSIAYTALIVLETVNPPLDANTMFLMLWDDATLVKEKRFGTPFALAGNAYVDTGSHELVLDGVGDWAVKTNITPGMVATPDWTIEWFMDMASTEVGGPFSHRSAQDFLPFLTGGGSVQMYVFGGNPMLTGAGVDGASHHWAFTCENGSPFRYRLYRDGVQVATTTSANARSQNDLATMYIGTDSFSPTGRDVAGRIGPMRVSNVCRYPNGTAFSPPAKTAWL
jgi:hypothetical protein